MEYLNPEAFFPQQAKGGIPPVLSGILDIQRLNDYNQLMQQHYERSEFDKKRREFEFQEKQKDAPVRDLERQEKTEGYLGRLPYVRDREATEAESQIEKNKYEILQKGPEARTNLKKQWEEQATDRKLLEMDRESKAMLEIVDGYRAWGPEWAAKRLEQYKNLGYPVDPRILDPNRQEEIRKGLLDTRQWVEAQRKRQMEFDFDSKLQAQRDAAAMDRTRYAADAATQRATTAAATKANRETLGKSAAQVEAIAIQKLAGLDPDSEDYAEWSDRYDAAVISRLREEATKDTLKGLTWKKAAQGDAEARARIEAEVAQALANKPKGKGSRKEAPSKGGSTMKFDAKGNLLQ